MNEAEKKDADRTCSEILFQALEEFNKSEATKLVLIYVNEEGDLVMMRNANNSQALGMCEFGKESVIRRIFED